MRRGVFFSAMLALGCGAAAQPAPRVTAPTTATSVGPVDEALAPTMDAVRIAVISLAESVEVRVDGVAGRTVCLGEVCRTPSGRRTRFELALPGATFVGGALLGPLTVDGAALDPVVVALDPGLVLSALPGASPGTAPPARRLSHLRDALWAPTAARRTLDAGALHVRLAAPDEAGLDALQARIAEVQTVLFERFGVRASRVAVALSPSDDATEEDILGDDFAVLRRLTPRAADQPALLELLASSVVRARTPPTIEPEAREGEEAGHTANIDAANHDAASANAANDDAAPAPTPTALSATTNAATQASPSDAGEAPVTAPPADADLPPLERRPRWLVRGFGRYGGWLLATDLRREGSAEGLRLLASAFERHRAHPVGAPLRARDDPDGVALALFCADVALGERGEALVEVLEAAEGTLRREPSIARALEAHLAFAGVFALDRCLRPLGLKLLARPVPRLSESDREALFEGAPLRHLRVAQSTSRLREGDVITHLHGQRVASPDDLDLALRDLETNARVIATVERDGRLARFALRVPVRRGGTSVRFWIHALPDAPGSTFPFSPMPTR